MSAALGMAWAVLFAWPLVRRARREAISHRARSVAPGHRPRVRPRRERRITVVGVPILRVPILRVPILRVPILRVPILRVIAGALERYRCRQRARRSVAELPLVTDLLGVAIGAGATPTHAVDLAARWSPPHAARVLDRVAGARSHGAAPGEALTVATAGEPGWAPIVEALLATDRLGAPIGPALARVAEHQRADLRRAAEAHARRVPVRLLFPLVFLVLPAFGLLTVVPVLIRGLSTF